MRAQAGERPLVLSACVNGAHPIAVVGCGIFGLTSFGGPIAHLAYFRREFVDRRHWLDDDAYTDLMALCQFFPAPPVAR